MHGDARPIDNVVVFLPILLVIVLWSVFFIQIRFGTRTCSGTTWPGFGSGWSPAPKKKMNPSGARRMITRQQSSSQSHFPSRPNHYRCHCPPHHLPRNGVTQEQKQAQNGGTNAKRAFIIGMCANMTQHVGTVGEGTLTARTCKRLLSRVGALMRSEMVLLHECLLASGATKAFLPFMNAAMTSQVGVAGEFLIATIALKSFLMITWSIERLEKIRKKEKKTSSSSRCSPLLRWASIDSIIGARGWRFRHRRT